MWIKFPFNQRLIGMDEMRNSLFLHEFFCSQLSSQAVNAWTQELPLLPAKKQMGVTRRSVRANWTLLIQLHENKHSSQTSSAAISPKRNRASFNNFQMKGGDIIVKNLRKEWRRERAGASFCCHFNLSKGQTHTPKFSTAKHNFTTARRFLYSLDGAQVCRCIDAQFNWLKS